MRRIGIIGTGLAGLRVAAELRGAGFDGRITAWDSGGGKPYDRPPLTKQLFGERQVPLARQGLGDLGDLGVEVIAREVSAIEPDGAGGWLVIESAGAVDVAGAGEATGAAGTVESGPVQVDVAVVATGSPPRGSVPGARVLYTLADADALAEAIAPGTRVDIVGGGWIGTELASTCAERGARVELWEASQHLLARSLGEAGTDIWLRWLEAAGVTVHLGRRHPGSAADGTVLVDATGSAPTFPRVAADVTARGALATDVQARVLLGGRSVAGLYAVGDCADRVSHPCLAGGHWTKALGDGALAAASILGTAPPPFLAPAEVFSTQFGREIGLVGVVPSSPPARESTRDGFVLRWQDEHGLAALLAVDSPRELSRARKALRVAI
ncbi:MAG: FAD-dependent oxidoreductase [Actinomycetaceae bacterium]|nr:FAD-dependent oxidoreductase [Actinomycetaceae bacterium]